MDGELLGRLGRLARAPDDRPDERQVVAQAMLQVCGGPLLVLQPQRELFFPLPGACRQADCLREHLQAAYLRRIRRMRYAPQEAECQVTGVRG
jgi:hypothetical protein